MADIVAGVDGCKGGWLCLTRRVGGGPVESRVYATARELFAQRPQPAVFAIDIPIGLPEAGSRECDREARRVLGWPRCTSVFPAPIRPALQARTREEASAITERIDGRKVGAQAWNLYGKIREVDEALAAMRPGGPVVREAHPEVCFWAWNGGDAIAAPKRSLEGRSTRRAMVDKGLGPNAFAEIRSANRKRSVADDDILDAFATLWTAERILRGSARTLPEEPPRDPEGLPEEIVY